MKKIEDIALVGAISLVGGTFQDFYHHFDKIKDLKTYLKNNFSDYSHFMGYLINIAPETILTAGLLGGLYYITTIKDKHRNLNNL